MRAGAILATGSASAALALLLGGCSSDKVVKHDKLADQVKSSLEKSVGAKSKGVDCPDDLKGKKGASTRCTIETLDGKKYGVTVTVTSVDGNNIKFTSQVDETAEK
jgi:Domain of unknown function (DUF4333)